MLATFSKGNAMFKVGDKVTIRMLFDFLEDPDVVNKQNTKEYMYLYNEKDLSHCSMVPEMIRMCGSVATIAEVNNTLEKVPVYYICEDEMKWSWREWMFRKVSTIKHLEF
jgi:hypothetical protein